MEMKTDSSKQMKRGTMSPRKKLMSYFREYCDYTGIHGFRYIGEDRTIFEKIWWMISLVLSVLLCGMMIYEIFQKYIHYPVLVTFSMKETHLQKIPFPAVTICPRAKISQSYLNLTDLFERKFENLPITIEEEKQLNLASTICEFYPGNTTINITKEKEFYDFLEESRTSFLDYCQYLGHEMNCSDIFTPILTEEGICYSYNILDREDIFRESVESDFPDFHKTQSTKYWNVEDGYTAREVGTYPKRALGIGVRNSLMIVMKVEISDLEYECAFDESGYRNKIDNVEVPLFFKYFHQVENMRETEDRRQVGTFLANTTTDIELHPTIISAMFFQEDSIVTLHSPFSIPDVPENYFIVPLNQRVIGSIIPYMIKTSDGVKMFDVSKRDCFFQSDRSLKFFKIYSQENCLIECKRNFTLKVCGCVEFFMPRAPGTPICLHKKMACLEEAEYQFSMFNAYSEITDSADMSNTLRCDCRPTCTEISYSTSLSHNALKLLPVNKTMRKLLDDEHYQYAALNLYFNRRYIETKERNELYGFSDVISNFGGLLGLFTGFSILSFMEIIYFCSLRLWGNLQLYGNWSGQKTK